MSWGYIYRRVHEKVNASSIQHKEEILLFITEFSGEKWDEAEGTENWTNAIDRRGQWRHVNDCTYASLQRCLMKTH